MVNRFMDWLADEARGPWTILGYVVFAALVVVSLDYSVENALVNWGFVKAPDFPKPGEHPFRHYNALMFISMFVWSPVKEEVIFRVLPLSVVIAFVSRSPRVVFGIMAAFTILFGAIHPYGDIAKSTVAIDGFFFGLVFLKCGGLNRSFVKASVCTMATHGFTNVFLILDEWWQYFELTS